MIPKTPYVATIREISKDEAGDIIRSMAQAGARIEFGPGVEAALAALKGRRSEPDLAARVDAMLDDELPPFVPNL